MRTKIHLPRLFTFFLCLSTAAAAQAAGAKENWTHYCVRCHGPDGTGNTKMGRKLRIKNLTQPKIQTRLTDDRIVEAVTNGNQTDDGEELMPAFKDKLTEAERQELVGFIRALAKGE